MFRFTIEFLFQSVAALVLCVIALFCAVLADLVLFLGGIARLVARWTPPWDDDEPDPPAVA